MKGAAARLDKIEMVASPRVKQQPEVKFAFIIEYYPVEDMYATSGYFDPWKQEFVDELPATPPGWNSAVVRYSDDFRGL